MENKYEEVLREVLDEIEKGGKKVSEEVLKEKINLFLNLKKKVENA